MKIFLVVCVVTSVGLYGAIGAKPSKQQHGIIIFPKSDEDMSRPVYIRAPANSTNKQHCNNIIFPDTETLIKQNTKTPVMEEALQHIIELPKENYQSPLRPLFIQLNKVKNCSLKYKTLRKTSKSVMHFFEEFLFGVSLRLSSTALKSTAG